MKRSRAKTPRTPTSHRRPSRRTQPDADAGLAAPAPNASARAASPAGDHAEGPTPLSLQSGAGRQYWDEVLRLLVNIRAECDAAAERLGYASSKDDGLAAVEYIANKVLAAVRGERAQQIANKPSASRSPEAAPPSVAEARHKSARHKSQQRPQPSQPPQSAEPAGHSARSHLVGELKQMLRDGKTKAGTVVDPALAHEIAKHITILNEEAAQPETAESLKRLRDSAARYFGKASASRQAPKGAAAAVAPKRKPATTEPRPAKQSARPGSKPRSR
jgi:hypothetical protein